MVQRCVTDYSQKFHNAVSNNVIDVLPSVSDTVEDKRCGVFLYKCSSFHVESSSGQMNRSGAV